MIVDTNVGIVANGNTPQASPACVLTCVQRLRAIVGGDRVVLDGAHLILDEYLKQRPHGSPRGTGDAFFVWVNDNQANEEHCLVAPVTVLDNDPRGFEEFPDDPELAKFDSDDRKFIAAAIGSGIAPPILEASDTKWWAFRERFAMYGVVVDFVCPDLMENG